MASVRAKEKNALNLKVLQRDDAKIDRILFTASHVVVYHLAEETGDKKWEKGEFEGALLLCHRNAAPLHRLVLLNRHSPR